MMSDRLRIENLVGEPSLSIDARFGARQRDVTLALAKKLHRFMLIDEAILFGALLRMNVAPPAIGESKDR